MKPTQQDLIDPQFKAIWRVIKNWDISRSGPGEHLSLSGATGTDVMEILTSLRNP
jgi:hypothetical protein